MTNATEQFDHQDENDQLPASTTSRQTAPSPAPPDSLSVTQTFLPGQIAAANEEQDQSQKPAPTLQSQAAPVASNDDEESIEDYMSRLLERVNSGIDEAKDISTPPAPRPPAPADARATVQMPVETESDNSESTVVTQPAAMTESAEPRQPAKAPEGRNDLLNLRQLANASVQDALRTHTSKQLIRHMYSWLAVVLAGSTSSFALATIAVNSWSMVYVGAIAAMMTGMLGAWQYASASRKLIRLASAVKVTKLEPAASK